MKIKLAILEPSKKHLSRIAAAFDNKYDDKLEVHYFTDLDMALESIKKYRIRVFLASESCKVDASGLDRCGFAYLTISKGGFNSEGERTVCIFDKIEDIYQKILEIFESVGGEWGGRQSGDESGRVLAFCSASGGVGASTMAAACAIRCAARHKRTLYLNLEKLGVSETFFEAQGNYTMRDVIYTLKSKKNNLHLKLASTVRHDASGVYFYAAPPIALDMMELNVEEIIRLLTELKQHCDYEYIILDMDFGLDKDTLSIFQETDVVVLVGDGTAVSNSKTERAYRAMAEIEQRQELYLTDRFCLLYNGAHSRTASTADLPDLRLLGKQPYVDNAMSKEVVQALAQSDILDQIL